MDGLDRIFHWAALCAELAGTAAMLIGAAVASVRYVWTVRDAPEHAYRRLRRSLGRSILLGLEFLIAGDIINTIAVKLDFRSLAALAIIVAIRTFLSFTLELEIRGRWPWQREAENEDGARPAPAPSSSGSNR